MPTRTHSTDPFAPRGALSPAQLAAYAEGRLTPAEQREVEAHLENDPLLRDAAEGLQQPGAIAAMRELHQLRPRNSGSSPGFMRIGIAAMAGAIVAVTVWYILPERQPNDVVKVEANAAQDASAAGDAAVAEPLQPMEIAQAQELPEFERIGHAPDDRHAKAMAPQQPVERVGLERMDKRNVDTQGLLNAADTAEHRSTAKPDGPHRISRQLMFLHDLKLVDPREMYAQDPQMQLAEESVAARFADRSAQDSVSSQNITAAYTAFMDEALYRFAQNDHRACLDDLRFLLAQYPDDVNALFYAGLCSYNLGLYKHARNFLHRAATHPIDVFDEEAQWYHALTLEQLDEHHAASEAFTRIAAGTGFYAERAKARIKGVE